MISLIFRIVIFSSFTYKMDLLKYLIGSSKSVKPCFLCFKNDINHLDINTVFEVHNHYGVISLSIADMLKKLFPSKDFVFMQACNDCSDLISQLYVLIHNRKSKIILLEHMVKQISLKTNASGIPVTKDKLVLNVQVPSYSEFDIKHPISKNNEYFENHSNSELNYVYNKSTNVDGNAPGSKICRQCSETFAHTDELKLHLKVHRKKRQRRRIYYSCNDCNYKTLSKTTLEAHINKNHLNTRPHICQVCYKGFFNRSNLNEHMKIHNNQRNQVCELCGCSFIHKKSLIEHLRLHSDTRPYKCHICQKSFVTSGRRSDHIKRSHMEKTECCLICNKKYSLKKELTRHMNNVHLRSM